MSVRNFFLKIGLIDLKATQMERLIQHSDDQMILWAFQNGRYDVRLMAVHYFSDKKGLGALEILTEALDDETELISQEAMKGLEKGQATAEIQARIEKKRLFWEEENTYREGRRNREHMKTSVMTESKERGSKRSMENLRNMLKKPMNSGKWF